jgi:hypothetical protein
MRSRRTRIGTWGLIAGLFALGSTGYADRILLRGGGVIDGVVLPPDTSKPGLVHIVTATAAHPYEFRKEQVERVEPAEGPLRDYVARRSTLAETAADHFALGEWCELNQLSGPAQMHYRRAVELDKDHGGAHQKLGHVYQNGRWMSYDEQRQAQGLVRYKGRWVSPEDKAALEQKAAFGAEQESWVRRLKVLRQKLLSGDPAQQQEAEGQLAAIREPAAVLPLLRVLGADPAPVRIRLAQILAAIDGPEAREALVQMILAEPDLDVRRAVLQELQTRHEEETTPRLIKALEDKNPVVVGRAAWALGSLGVVSAVPRLIPKLVKVETKWVMDPLAQRQPGLSATFGSIGPGPVIPPNAGVGTVGGANGSVATGPGFAAGNGSSLPILTGPAVGDGVVAYGATSIPYGDYTGLNFGGANPNRPTARLITNVYNNEEVLLALRRLTGADFGYDVDSWRGWLRSSFRPDTMPERRVPEP